MLYFIPFQYTALNNPTARTVAASLIVDLPQTTLAEAQRNLLVRDLVRFAYVRNCYLHNTVYLTKPESILQIYNGAMPTNLPQVRVVSDGARFFNPATIKQLSEYLTTL